MRNLTESFNFYFLEVSYPGFSTQICGEKTTKLFNNEQWNYALGLRFEIIKPAEISTLMKEAYLNDMMIEEM